MTDVHIVIPSRIGSTRLSKKPLQKLGNKTLLERVFDNAAKSKFSSIFIATDDSEILDLASNFSNNVIITSAEHVSGTDRIHELCTKMQFKPEDIVINLQGDEPFMPLEIINAMPDILDGFDVATACVPILDDEDIENINNVKVWFSKDRALYFSRSAKPDNFTNTYEDYYKHIGIYAYKVKTLKTISSLKPTKLELAEKLEQLRFLDHGLHIGIRNFNVKAPIGIDTEEDLIKAQKLFS